MSTALAVRFVSSRRSFKIGAEPQPGWHAVRRAAERVQRRTTRLVRQAFGAGKHAVDHQVLADALMNRGTDSRAIDYAAECTVARVREAMRGGVERALGDVLRAAGAAELRVARTRGGFRAARHDPRRIPLPGSSVLGALRFDVTNAAAVRWIREHAARDVEGISEESRRVIVAELVRSFERGVPTAAVARRIRSVVGLTAEQAQAVAGLADRIAENPGNRIYAGERPIRVPEDPSDEWTERQLDRYADKLLNDRAKSIARTETIAAANEGQREAWLQAEESGLLDRDEVVRTWIVTPDERLCPICDALDGATAELDGEFQSEDVGAISGPPAHPQCRCAQGLERRGL